jgi:hypothetical protein
MRLKTTELNALERKIANFVEFVGEGRGSRTLAQALEAAERESGTLRAEIEGLDQSQKAVFQIPPAAWIEERLVTIQAVLERKTEKAAMLLRKLLGPIRLEPVQPEVGRPYYRAVSTLDALAIIEEDPEGGPSEPGSNTLRKWRQGELNLMKAMMGSAKELFSYWFWVPLRSRTPANATDLGPGGPFPDPLGVG